MKHRPDMHQTEQNDEDWQTVKGAMSAPERIWVCPDDDRWFSGSWDLAEDGLDLEAEYIRADLARPKVKPLVWGRGMKHRPDMHQTEQNDEDWQTIEGALREVFAVLALIVLAASFGGALLLWWLL